VGADQFSGVAHVAAFHNLHAHASVERQSEAEAIRPIAGGAGLSANSDEPRFRYYEIPGCGHSSVLPGGEHEIEAIARVRRRRCWDG
jgi:hypothetical protein